MAVLELPAGDRMTMLKAAAQEGMTGGRIYDAHIAHVARAAGATLIVTTISAISGVAPLRHPRGNPTEFLSTVKAR
jgi:hypothetical protein